MSLTLEPIGFIKTSYKKKYDAPKQAHIEVAKEAKIVLNAQQNFEMALSDLSGFSHIWLIYHFHKNSHWKPKVLPPRKDRTKRGLFATRSPYRPNPIGMSVVCLEEIKGRTLYISNHDLLDGTPILDIKPYLAYSDSHPAASQGWLEENDSADYILEYTELAKEQNQWLLQKRH
jgi:tRNA-Thr(GGU) m(6)t(6)A37 methyltransferase TsaA